VGAGGLAAAGRRRVAAPKAVSELTYDFGLPGQAGYEANQQIMRQFGSGGDNAPVLLVVGTGRQQVPAVSAIPVVQALDKAAPGRLYGPAGRCTASSSPAPYQATDHGRTALLRLSLEQKSGQPVITPGRLQQSTATGDEHVMIATREPNPPRPGSARYASVR